MDITLALEFLQNNLAYCFFACGIIYAAAGEIKSATFYKYGKVAYKIG